MGGPERALERPIRPLGKSRFAIPNRKEPCRDYRTSYPSVASAQRRAVRHRTDVRL